MDVIIGVGGTLLCGECGEPLIQTHAEVYCLTATCPEQNNLYRPPKVRVEPVAPVAPKTEPE